MNAFNDDLAEFTVHRAKPLPAPAAQGHVEYDGACIWYVTLGTGRPVILLYGGLGHNGSWGYQVPTSMTTGYRPIVIGSRGRGRNTCNTQPYTYARVTSDVHTVMNMLCIDCALFIGWNDCACVTFTLAMQTPERAIGMLFFGCNMDPSDAKLFEPTPVIDHCFARHRKDYTALSSTPGNFDAFITAVTEIIQTQPNAMVAELTATRMPMTIAYSERDEFIRPEHAHYLA